MIPVLSIDNVWMWFCIASGTAFIFSIIMNRAGTLMMTHDGSLRAFTIIDLEFPSNPKDIPNILKGIYKLTDAAQRNRVIKALKQVLYFDFLFMPAIYSAIFLICMQVAVKLPEASFGQYLFATLAWLQAIAWLCDVLENGHLLRWVRMGTNLAWELPRGIHRRYVVIVWLKWGIALLGGISALMIMIYFWMKGAYAPSSLLWMGIYALEIILFGAAGLLFSAKKKAETA